MLSQDALSCYQMFSQDELSTLLSNVESGCIDQMLSQDALSCYQMLSQDALSCYQMLGQDALIKC